MPSEAGASAQAVHQSTIQDLPPEVLLDVLVRAGAWPEVEGVPLGVSKGSPVASASWHWAQERPAAPRDMTIHSSLSVCRQWRDAVKGSVAHMAALLLEAHDSVKVALVGACSIRNEAVARHLLELPRLPRLPQPRRHPRPEPPRADCLSGRALGAACEGGREGILGWKEHAPYSDGQSMVAGAKSGKESLVQLLLDSPQPCTFTGNPSLGRMIPQSGMVRSHVWEMQVFVAGAERGYVGVVRLLHKKTNAACGAGACAKDRAAAAGHMHAVRAINELLNGPSWIDELPAAETQPRGAKYSGSCAVSASRSLSLTRTMRRRLTRTTRRSLMSLEEDEEGAAPAAAGSVGWAGSGLGRTDGSPRCAPPLRSTGLGRVQARVDTNCCWVDRPHCNSTGPVVETHSRCWFRSAAHMHVVKALCCPSCYPCSVRLTRGDHFQAANDHVKARGDRDPLTLPWWWCV